MRVLRFTVLSVVALAGVSVPVLGLSRVQAQSPSSAPQAPTVPLVPTQPLPPATSGVVERGSVNDRANEPVENEPDTAVVDGRQVETIRQRNEQGQVRMLRQVAQDAEGNYFNHGVWKRWDEEGNLIGLGEYRDGNRHGHWEMILFTAETPLLRQEPYRQFPGPFLSEVNFTGGTLEGKWVISDVDGKKISEIELAAGQRHGTATWWYANGQRYQEINYRNGLLDGDLIRWSPSGQEISRKTFQQGRELIVKAENDSRGQKVGETTILSPQLVVVNADDWTTTKFVAYKAEGEAMKHGVSRRWHPNGQKSMEGQFENDAPVGKHSWWHVNGQKSLEGNFRNGKHDGVWTWWHPNGQKSSQGEYLEGVPMGDWSWWAVDGKVIQRAAMGTASSPRRSPRSAEPTPARATTEPVNPSTARRK